MIALFALAGCGGGSVTGFSNSGVPTVVSINNAGGAVNNGAAGLAIPANTVSTSTNFTVGQATGYPADSRLLAGTAYFFDASGAFLLQPVTFSISYGTLPTGAVESSLAMYVVVNNAWKAVSGSSLNTSTKTVSVTVQTAGTYAIFVTQTTSVTSQGTILLNRGAHTASNAMSAMNTDGSGYHSLLSSAANSYVSAAHYAPNGTAIVYDFTDGVHGFSIFGANADGTAATKLTGGALKPDSSYSSNTQPSYSADGSTIVYLSDVTGTPEVYTMTAAGATITQITTLVNTAISNVFFTKAGKIAFYATVGGLSSWYQVNSDGTGLAAVNALPVNISLISPWTAYSPNGATIATGYLQGTTYDLYAFSTNGSVKTKLTSLGASAILAPHYTSDGTKIVFEAIVNGTPSIFTVSSTGTNLTNLTVSSGPDALLDLH